MHRRQLLGMIAGALILPPSTALSQTAPVTPASTPEHSGGSRPIVLGDGIELLDYRIYPSDDVRRVIGEIWNTREEMVDAPVVSMLFPTSETSDGVAYAPPFTPVLRPGESTMIFGVLPEEIDSDDALASGSFGLCGPVVAGEHTERHRNLDLQITRDVVNLSNGQLNVQGEIRNEGAVTATYTCVRGLVRDHNHRYAGCTLTVNTGHLAPGGTHRYSLWAEGTLADPAKLLIPGRSYSVDVIPGLVGPLTAPGCASVSLRD